MRVKKVLSLLLAVATLAATVSCSSGAGSQKASSDSDGLESGNSKELTMYIMDYDATSQKAVEKFNQIHKDVQIKAKSLTAIPAGNLGSKLMYELNSGKGPDIILCEENTLPNLSVFFNKGSFYDLNTLINKDKSFKKTDYFEKVMEYGEYKDKRYVMPLSFKIDSLYTTQDILDKSGQGISRTGAGIDDFIKGSKSFISTAGNDKYFISDIDYGTLLQTAPKSFFDLANKTADFNSRDFGDLLDKYKTLTETTCPDILVSSPAQSNNLLSNNKVSFYSVQLMGPRYAAEPYGSFKSEVLPVILPAPFADTTRHIIARPEKYIGINSKCGNAEAAYDFIKLMLSKDFQDTDLMEGIPVNREAYTLEKEMCLKGIKGYESWKKGGCSNTDTLKKIYSQMDKLIEGIDRCWTTDDYLVNLVKTEADNYINKNSTKENMLKTIQEKVEGYLKSGIMIESLTDKAADETPVDPSKTVTLYYWNNTECFVTNSIDAYNEKYQDIKIKKKAFDSYEGYRMAIGVELMAGGGPDIIIFQPRYFKSIGKTIESGAFCVMDDYIKKYDILNPNEYNEGMLDGGVYGGKRYYIPLYYYHAPLFTTNRLLDENKIEIKDGNWLWDKFAEYSKAFSKANKNKHFAYGLSIKTLLENSDVQFIDYQNKKSNFNSEQFIKLLRLYKGLYPCIEPNNYTLQQKLEGRENVFFFSLGGTGEAAFFKILYEEATSKEKEDMVAVPTPTLTGKFNVYAIPSYCIGVNSRCRNKDAAFKYIKIAASYEMQRDYDKRGKVNGTLSSPVSNKAYSDDLLSYQASGALPKTLVDSLINDHKLVKDCLVKDYSILDIIEELSQAYIEGRKAEDQVVKEIDDKVNVFLNE